MIKRVTDETTEGIPGIALEKNEKILFCGHSRKNLKNPASNNEKYPETVMLTSRRVVTLTSLPTAGGVPALTTIPLKRISTIQTTYLGWTPAKVLLCMVFFLLYVIPGIVFLTYMCLKSGPTVYIVAGNVRTDAKFDPNETVLFRKFLSRIELYATV